MTDIVVLLEQKDQKMSWNNTTPGWLLGDFNKHFERMEKREITVREFYDCIKDLEEVPQFVKANWLVTSEEETYWKEKNRTINKTVENSDD